MASTFWEQVRAGGLQVPEDRPLDELTTELTAMLGDPDPHVRDALAHQTLAAWISAGVYDELLQGLGDGMAAGLDVGLGEDGTDSVFRRTYSARVLTACVLRDNERHLLAPDTILVWGDRLAGWFVRERDLRGPVAGRGWARAAAHGADAIAALAGAESIGGLELTVLLDVLADRLLVPTTHRLLHGEDDRLAFATMQVLRRNLLTTDVLEPWLARLGDHGRPDRSQTDASVVAHNVQSYLRALHLQLALAPGSPGCRSDVLLVLIDQLRETNPGLLRQVGPDRSDGRGLGQG